jgi:hypothetical protein
MTPENRDHFYSEVRELQDKLVVPFLNKIEVHEWTDDGLVIYKDVPKEIKALIQKIYNKYK